MDADIYYEGYARAAERHPFAARLAEGPPLVESYDGTTNTTSRGYSMLVIVGVLAVIFWVSARLTRRFLSYNSEIHQKEKELIIGKLLRSQAHQQWEYPIVTPTLSPPQSPPPPTTLSSSSSTPPPGDEQTFPGLIFATLRIVVTSIFYVTKSLGRLIWRCISNTALYRRFHGNATWLIEVLPRWIDSIYYSDAANMTYWYWQIIWSWVWRQKWTFCIGVLMLCLVSNWVKTQRRAAETLRFREARCCLQVPGWIYIPRRTYGSNSHYGRSYWPPEADPFEVDEDTGPPIVSRDQWVYEDTKDPKTTPGEPDIFSSGPADTAASDEYITSSTAVDESSQVLESDALGSSPLDLKKETQGSPAVVSDASANDMVSAPNLTPTLNIDKETQGSPAVVSDTPANDVFSAPNLTPTLKPDKETQGSSAVLSDTPENDVVSAQNLTPPLNLQKKTQGSRMVVSDTTIDIVSAPNLTSPLLKGKKQKDVMDTVQPNPSTEKRRLRTVFGDILVWCSQCKQPHCCEVTY